MGFFDLKTTCAVCNKTVGLNRFQLSPGIWICPNCLKSLGGTSKFTYLRTKSIEELKNMLNEKSTSNVEINKPEIIANNSSSNIDELLKYKELLDKNIITQEEFNNKKNEILNINTTKVQEKNVNKHIPPKTSSKKSGLGKFIIFFILMFIIALTVALLNETNQPKSFLIKQYNLSEEEAEEVIDIINDCGYSEYYSGYRLQKGVNNEEIDESVGLEIIKGNDIIGFVDLKDNIVYLVQYSDKILYQNGDIQHTLSEYIVSEDEKSNLIYKTKETIKVILKSPSTAKFPWDYNEWKFGKKDGSTIVQGYVDSQNGFGAMIRSTFQVTYTNGVVVSLILDGIEYIK